MKRSKYLDLLLKPGPRVCFLYKYSKIVLFLACLIIVFPRCAPVFSELQSAKLVGPGNVEASPSFSTVSYISEDNREHAQNHFGIQAGLGIFNRLDFRLRYEGLSVDEGSDESYWVNVFGFGPKFSVVKNWVAVYVPVGSAFGGGEKVSDNWQFHPTLLLTLPLNKFIEFNPSAKILIPFKKEQATKYAFNLGLGLSTNLEKWALRPEIGFLYDAGTSYHYMHLSIGFTYFHK